MDNFDGSISDIVKKDYRTADVFKKFQLSYCCSGSMLLKSACETKGIDFELVSAELRRSTRDILISNDLPFGDWKIDFLVDFICNIHHTYIYQVVPVLSDTLRSFSASHQAKYPELTTVSELVTNLTELLMIHNRHEDEIIFPYIKQIDSAYRRKEPYGNLFVRTLRKPLHNVEKEHVEIQKMLSELQVATNHFTIPDKACLTHQVIYKKLEELFNNLAQHKFLEHDILFPKAIAIEQKLLQL